MLAAIAAPAAAQFAEYTAVGSLAARQVSTRDQVEAAMDEARWHLGPLRLAPWIGLRDVTYVNNVFDTATDTTSDVTATAGAGLHGYVPIGPKLTLGAYALPEYVWWRRLANRRVWNGRYGVGLFGYFNRLTVEAKASDSRQQQYASSEVEQPVNLRQQEGKLDVEVKLLERLAVFATASEDRFRYRRQDLAGSALDLLLLDRDERHAGGGLRYRWSESVMVGVGVEHVGVDFVRAERDRSAAGDAPVFEAALDGKRLRLDANIMFPTLRPQSGSQFVRFSGTTGRVQLGFKPVGRLEWQLYGGRNLAFSVSTDSPYFIDERAGLAVQSPLGWRATGQAFYERGRDVYSGLVAEAGTIRRTDLRAFGGGADLAIGRHTWLSLQASRTDYSSAGPFGDRSITRVQTGLRFGSAAAEWW